mgnify:CR=1 FL=1
MNTLAAARLLRDRRADAGPARRAAPARSRVADAAGAADAPWLVATPAPRHGMRVVGLLVRRRSAEASCAQSPFGVGIGAQLAGWLLVAAAHAALLWAVLDARAARTTVAPPRPVLLTLVATPERRLPPPTPLPLPPPPAPTLPPRPLPPLPQFEVQAPVVVAPSAVATAPAAAAIDAAPAVAMAAPPTAPAALSVAPPIRTVSAESLGFAVAPVLRYPTLSRRLGEEGRVLLRVRIDARGVPVELAVVDSSGHARLDEAALDAARRARLRPLIDGGEPRSAWVLLPFVFALENS